MRSIINFFLVIIVLSILVFPLQKSPTDSYDSYGMRLLDMFSNISKKGNGFLGNAGDLTDFSIKKNSIVSGPTDVSGVLRGGYFFEGNAKGMLLDSNKKIIKTFSITASGDWMKTEGVPFSTSVDATGIAPGLGYVRIANDNPSGDTSKDKFIDTPVIFK